MPSLASLRSSLLGTLLIIVSLAALANTVRADQTVATATTLEGQSPVQTGTASCEALAVYVQMLEFLLVVVLIVAAVALFLLVRLHRKTRFCTGACRQLVSDPALFPGEEDGLQLQLVSHKGTCSNSYHRSELDAKKS